MAKKREIRNSTAEFLPFLIEGKDNGIQALYKDETIWATQMQWPHSLMCVYQLFNSANGVLMPCVIQSSNQIRCVGQGQS